MTTASIATANELRAARRIAEYAELAATVTIPMAPRPMPIRTRNHSRSHRSIR